MENEKQAYDCYVNHFQRMDISLLKPENYTIIISSKGKISRACLWRLHSLSQEHFEALAFYSKA